MLAAIAALAALGLGGAVLPGGPLEPLTDGFGTGELFGWAALAMGTGGLVFGVRQGRTALVAAGLVGSAALLGADPASCAVIGLSGAIGGLVRERGHARVRIGVATLLGWMMPGILAAAAQLDGRSFGLEHPFPLLSVLALWATLAVGLPLIESAVGRLMLPPAERVGPAHSILLWVEQNSVLTALAVLAAMSYATVGPAAALIVLLPVAAARTGFAMHAEGRRAVTQTLAAMTKLPEWTDMVSVGHTDRVRATVERVAVELGLESRLRQDVVRAAELHELGHLDTGADRDDRGRVARSGAAVLEQAAMRERVTDIVDATDPDRPLAARDADVQLGAAILATACELDRTERIADIQDAAQHIVADVSRAKRPLAARF